MYSGQEVIITALIAIVLAQVLKVFFYYRKFHVINYKLLSSTGGVPSSHSTAVVATMTSLGFNAGVDSSIFAVAVVFGIVVMYDAAGPRRATGQIATQVNMLIDRLYKKRPAKFRQKLKELLGHTPFEVFMGALLGFFVACLVHYIWGVQF